MIVRSLLLLAVTAPLAIADVKFTSPTAGGTVTGGGKIAVQWTDSGQDPKLTDLSSYQLFLCAGGNDPDNFIQLASIVPNGEFSTGNAASGTVDANIGGSATNAYFLKMISVATTGGTVTNYSPRFSLSGMTGTFPANVQAGLKTVTGTSGPATVNDVGQSNQQGQNAAAGAGGQTGGALFSTPYPQQTGLTRYAPMPPQPVTKIVKQSPTPQWPTSAVQFAMTVMSQPNAQTTITASATFSVSSRENTAAAASQPTDAMQKYLNRWKD